MILVDTNVLSELIRSEPDATVVSWMDSWKKSEIGVTAISVTEILYGIGTLAKGKRK